MAQPKKSGPPGRKPAARKPAARKPTASKPPRGRPAAKRPGAASAEAGTGAAEQDARAAQRREEQLVAALQSLGELLARGMIISADRLQETVDEAVKRGRMTAQDAEELFQAVAGIGRRQTQDVLVEIEALVERSATQTRRFASSRARSAAAAARRAPAGDRALRTVDRVRRAARFGQPFPISGYDELTAAQVKQRLVDLSAPELRKVRDHERRNARRKSVLAAIERRLGG